MGSLTRTQLLYGMASKPNRNNHANPLVFYWTVRDSRRPSQSNWRLSIHVGYPALVLLGCSLGTNNISKAGDTSDLAEETNDNLVSVQPIFLQINLKKLKLYICVGLTWSECLNLHQF